MILAASILYGLAACVCARMLAGHFAWTFALNRHERQQRKAKYEEYKYTSLRPDTEITPATPTVANWADALVLSALIALLWPLTLFFAHAPIPKIGAEREAEKRQMRERIEELEKQVGI